MNSEHRNIWAALLSGLIVNAYFFHRIWGMFGDGTSIAPDAMQIWARTIIWAIPAAIVATIAMTILVSIATGIVTGETSTPTLKDERDRLFQLWGLGVTMAFTVVGFVTAVFCLAFGQSGFLAFNFVYLGCALGDMAGNSLKLVLYRTR
jgi:hypothetical protein